MTCKTDIAIGALEAISRSRDLTADEIDMLCRLNTQARQNAQRRRRYRYDDIWRLTKLKANWESRERRRRFASC